MGLYLKSSSEQNHSRSHSSCLNANLNKSLRHFWVGDGIEHLPDDSDYRVADEMYRAAADGEDALAVEQN